MPASDRQLARTVVRQNTGNRETFLKMQFPPPAVIVKPIGHIGVLLNLAQRDTRADSVDSSGFRIVGVARFHLNRIQKMLDRLVLDGSPKLILRRLSLKPSASVEPGLAERMCHISVFPRQFSTARAYSSSG